MNRSCACSLMTLIAFHDPINVENQVILQRQTGCVWVLSEQCGSPEGNFPMFFNTKNTHK